MPAGGLSWTRVFVFSCIRMGRDPLIFCSLCGSVRKDLSQWEASEMISQVLMMLNIICQGASGRLWYVVHSQYALG